jgi:hypothetical protein
MGASFLPQTVFFLANAFMHLTTDKSVMIKLQYTIHAGKSSKGLDMNAKL